MRSLPRKLAFFVVCLASLSFAGSTTYNVLKIDLKAQKASGQFGDVRADATSDFMSCWIDSSTSLGEARAYCDASSSSTGQYVYCTSKDPVIVSAVQSINSDSYIVFWWDAAGECTRVIVQTDSASPPKVP